MTVFIGKLTEGKNMHFKIGQQIIDFVRCKKVQKFIKNKSKMAKAKAELEVFLGSGRIKYQSDISREEWDKFVYESSMGWAFFLYDVMLIDRHDNYKNVSFAILDEKTNEIQMLVQLYLTDNNTFFSRWGFVLKDNLSKKQKRKVKECFEEYIDKYMAANNITYFSMELAHLSNLTKPSDIKIVNPLINFNFKPNIGYDYMVDLSKPDDRMLADCEETTRQAIRKYRASGKYKIVEAKNCSKDFKTYTDLHAETYTRTGAKKYIICEKFQKNIFENLIPRGICKVYFLEDTETKERIASVAILVYGNCAHYWWGASKNKKEVGINKYLLFSVIEIIRSEFNKTGFFDTGGAYPYLRAGKQKGISEYKKCFGTFMHPVYSGEYQCK